MEGLGATIWPWRSSAEGPHGVACSAIDLTRSEWIEIGLAATTFLLAVATFILAYYARKSAREGAAALAAFEKQAVASERHAIAAERALDEQTKQVARQQRAHVVWIDSSGDENNLTVDTDLHYYGDNDAEGRAIVLRARVRNLSSTPVYLERVEHPKEISVVIIDDPYLLSGADGRVTIYIPAKIGAEIAFMKDALTLHCYSMLTGLAATSVGFLNGVATVRPVARDRLTTAAYEVYGGVWVSPDAQPPMQM